MGRWLIACCLAVSLLAVACGGSSSNSGTPTPAPVVGAQEQALKALSSVRNGVVNVTGHASQNGDTADFTIQYETDGDNFSYHAQSTYHGSQSDVQVIGVPPQAWSLEGGTWTPLPAGPSVDSFRARRIWSVAPFPSATVVGTDQIDGVAATHYHYAGATALAFGELAGSLIATSDVNFTGELKHVTVDYWVAKQGGFPVKAVYKASGDGDLGITAELSRLNDSTVVVQPPR